jgi:hypothetical protein
MPIPDKHPVTCAAGDPLDILEPGQLTDNARQYHALNSAGAPRRSCGYCGSPCWYWPFMVGYTFVTQLWP